MKRIFKILTAAPLLAVLLNACQPADYKEIGVQREHVSTLAGTWKLSRVTQTDEDAARKGFPFQTLDVTNAFPYTDFRLTFNANGTTPTTFSTTPGTSPRIIRLTSGNWSVDDPMFPKVLTLANPTDTARITLGSYPGSLNPSLKVRLEKRDAGSGKVLISYSYEFTKQ